MSTLLVAALLSSPSADAQEVRAIHLSPDAPPVDLYVDDTSAPAAELAFTGATSTTLLSPGPHRLGVAPTGGEIFYDTRFRVEAGEQTTVALIGGRGSFQAVTLRDQMTRIPRAAAHLDIVHAAENLGEVNVNLGRIGMPAGSAAFGDALSTMIPAIDNTRLGVDADLDGHADFDFDLGMIRPGASVDLFLTESRDGRPGLVAWYDNGEVVRIPSNFIAPAFLRVAHLSPDAPMIDAYVDGELVADDLDFTDVATELRIDAGYRHVAIVSADGDEVLLDTELEVGPGTKTMVYAYGTADMLKGGVVTVNDEVPVRDGAAKFTIVHAADTVGTVGLIDERADEPLTKGSGLRYGNQLKTRHRVDGSWTLGVDTNADRMSDVSFEIPELMGNSQVTVFAVADANGPFLQAYLEDGTSVRIDPSN
jgi:hypothetical protein